MQFRLYKFICRCFRYLKHPQRALPASQQQRVITSQGRIGLTDQRKQQSVIQIVQWQSVRDVGLRAHDAIASTSI